MKTSSSSYQSTHTLTLPLTFPFPLCLFTSLTNLCFTITLPSSFSLSYNLTLLLLILFCINLISFLLFNPYFSHTKNVSTLSLSLSLLCFGKFLFFLKTLIKVVGFFFFFFFFNMCFGIVCQDICVSHVKNICHDFM